MRRPLRVLPGIYQVSVLGSAVTVLEDRGRVVLVDAGLRTSPRKVGELLEGLGLGFKAVTHVLVTHGHPDHIGGLARMKEATGALVGAHPLEVPAICGGESSPPPLSAGVLGGIMAPLMHFFRPRPVAVDLPLQEGFRLDILGGMEVLHTPGHTPGTLSFYFPGLRLLHVGDALQCWGGRPGLPNPWFTQDMARAKESARRLAELDVETLVFSHFSPLPKGAGEALRGLAGRIS